MVIHKARHKNILTEPLVIAICETNPTGDKQLLCPLMEDDYIQEEEDEEGGGGGGDSVINIIIIIVRSEPQAGLLFGRF